MLDFFGMPAPGDILHTLFNWEDPTFMFTSALSRVAIALLVLAVSANLAFSQSKPPNVCFQ